MSESPLESTTAKTFWGDFILSARANALPAIGLQSVALFMLWAYHFWPAARLVLEQLAGWKQITGYSFSFIASALAGGLLPFILQRFQSGNHRRIKAKFLPDLLFSWGARGCLVDAFYRLQTAMWGDNALPQTLLVKIFCDLMFFSPLIAAPTIALMFSWADSERNPARFRLIFKDGLLRWFMRDVWPVVRMAWVVWLPALAVIYALPAGLQFPVQVVIQCLWALILVVLTDKNGHDKSQAASNAA